MGNSSSTATKTVSTKVPVPTPTPVIIHTPKSNWVTSQILLSLEKIIFNLNEENIKESVINVEKLINNNNNNDTSLFNIFLIHLVYSSFNVQFKDINIYISFMKEIEEKIENNQNEHKITNSFIQYILSLNTQESYFLLDKLIELNLISSDLIKDKKTFYFLHYLSEEEINKLRKYFDKNAFNLSDIPYSNYISENYERLSQNNWELHKKYVKKGVNPNKIAKIIRNDKIEKLQDLSSQSDFDFNQKIEPSLYERCSFINKKNISLIDYAAFFGSINCFKFLMLNGARLPNTGKYSLVGENLEIIHLCEQKHSLFDGSYKAAIEFHRNDMFHYIYENKIGSYYDAKLLNIFPKIDCLNIELFCFLFEQRKIELNSKDLVDLNNLKFHNNVWELFQ